jgi:hypothetical protein
MYFSVVQCNKVLRKLGVDRLPKNQQIQPADLSPRQNFRSLFVGKTHDVISPTVLALMDGAPTISCFRTLAANCSSANTLLFTKGILLTTGLSL